MEEGPKKEENRPRDAKLSHLESMRDSNAIKEYSDWLEKKEEIKKQFQKLGVNITCDSEFFILNLKDKNNKPYQVKIHAWETIPVIMNPKDKSSTATPVDVERIIKACVEIAPEYESGKDSPSMKELLDRFAPENSEEQ